MSINPSGNYLVELGKEKAATKSVPLQFEEALTLTGFGKFNYFLIVLCGVILSTIFLETLGISFVLPVAECELLLTTQQKGVLNSIAFAGIISSSHLWGFLADTIGRRRIILPTLFISFCCSLISSFTSNYYLLVILRFFCGFFISGPSATVYAYLSEFHNLKNRSRAIMGASVVFGCGCLMLPGIAWLIINQEWYFYLPLLDITYKPWRLFLIVCGVPSLVCALALLKLPESPKFILLQGDQEKTIDTIKKIHKYNGGLKKGFLEIDSIYDESIQQGGKNKTLDELKSVKKLLKAMWYQTAPLFQRNHLRTTFLACAIQFSIFFVSNGMYMWFPDILNKISEYLEEHPNSPATICEMISMKNFNVNTTILNDGNEIDMICIDKLEIAAYTNTLMLEVVYIIGFSVIGLLINPLGKLPILIFVLVGCGFASIAAAFTTNVVLSIYLYLIMLSVGIVISVVNAATVDLFPTNLRAMSVCIALMIGRLGSVVGTNVSGYFFEYDCPSAFIFSGSLLIGSGILAVFIPQICRWSLCRNDNNPLHATIS